MVLDAATDMLAPVELSYQSPQAVISPHMTESMIVVILALLCTVILLAGLAIIVPWDYIWRLCHDYMATRRANTGMKAKSIEALPCIIYSKSMSRLATDCAICLAEFAEGEGVRVLPICNHGFHMECVDKWLQSHSSCPTCKHYVVDPGCKMVASHIMPSKSDAWRVQIHQARACEESSEIIDLEFGVK